MSYLGIPETYYGDDGFTEEDFAEQEWRLDYIFNHPATDGVIELVDTVSDRNEVLAKIRMGEVEKWFDNNKLWELMNHLDEDDNAPFWKKMIEDWFEGSK